MTSTKTRACELEDRQKTSQRRAELALSLSGLTSLNLSSTPHERGVVQRVEYTKRASERKNTVTKAHEPDLIVACVDTRFMMVLPSYAVHRAGSQRIARYALQNVPLI